MDQTNNAVSPKVGAVKTRLSHAERAKRRARIPELFAQGWSDEQIAHELGLTPAYVYACRIKSDPCCTAADRNEAKRQAREENIQQLCETILELRGKGITSRAEMVDQVKQPANMVNECIRRLIAEGRTKPCSGKYFGNESKVRWRDLNDHSTQTFISMVKKGATLEQLGKKFDITGERSRQIIENLKEAHGEKVLQGQQSWTISQAAVEIAASYDHVMRLCRDGKIPCRKRGKRQYLIDAQGMEALRTTPLFTWGVCKICGQPARRTICSSKKCLSENWRRYSAALLARPVTGDSLGGWHKDLWKELRSHRLRKTERWLRPTQACRYTGLTKMQLGWLRIRKVVKTRDHPSKARLGTPYQLYSSSQMEIVRKVYAAWQRKQKRRKKKKSP